MRRQDFIKGLVAAVPALATTAPTEAKGKRRRRCEGCGPQRRCNRKLQCVRGRCVPKSAPVICGDAYEACPAKLEVFCTGTGGSAQCCNKQGHNCKAATLICPI